MQLIEEKIKCDKYEMFEKSSDEYTILKECEQKEYDQIEREILITNIIIQNYLIILSGMIPLKLLKQKKINTKA